MDEETEQDTGGSMALSSIKAHLNTLKFQTKGGTLHSQLQDYILRSAPFVPPLGTYLAGLVLGV